MVPAGNSLLSCLCGGIISADITSRFNETLGKISATDEMPCLGNYPHFVVGKIFLLNLLFIKVFGLDLL